MEKEANQYEMNYRQARIEHWDRMAIRKDHWKGWGQRYHRRLEQIFRHHIPPGMRVLEIGCGFGDLLAALEPSCGVGIDFSSEMIARAKTAHPSLHFQVLDAHQVASLGEPFDAIILSDLVNDLWDVQAVLEEIQKICHPGTRIFINVYSRMWQVPILAAENLSLATRNMEQNWLTGSDLRNLLALSGFETIQTRSEILFPLPFPLLDDLCDRILVKLWPFYWFNLTNIIIARPQPAPVDPLPSVTVVVPARNEAGNVPAIFQRIPEMGSGTEIIFVEGNSSDDTYQRIEQEIPLHPDQKVRLFKQPGKGKADAVRVGFNEASGDILMILDADLTVPPEDLPRFYQAIASGKGEFINGVRLVYPMEDQAMRFLNFLGNKFFSLAFTWLLGQPIKDTLCGTKVLLKSNYEKIAANRSYFGDFDPFGDFDLLFGAARLNLKILDLPIRYRERTYGTTNISRWSHGLLLLKMVFFAATRLKFR